MGRFAQPSSANHPTIASDLASPKLGLESCAHAAGLGGGSAMQPWPARLIDEQLAGNITRTERDALMATRSLIANGNATPTHNQIARRAGCSRRTVVRAHERGRELGLMLHWHQFNGRNGRQSGNRYRLIMPGRRVKVCQRRRTPKNPFLLQSLRGTTAPRARPPLRSVAEQLAWLAAEIARERDQSSPKSPPMTASSTITASNRPTTPIRPMTNHTD